MTNSQRSALIGSQRPTFQSLPVDRRGSAGQEAVELAALAGLELDDWQAWLLEEMLHVGSDARWSAFEVGLVVPRQNGKGGIIEAVVLYVLFVLGAEFIVWSAHEYKTAERGFRRLEALVRGVPHLASRVEAVREANGEQRGHPGRTQGQAGDLVLQRGSPDFNQRHFKKNKEKKRNETNRKKQLFTKENGRQAQMK